MNAGMTRHQQEQKLLRETMRKARAVAEAHRAIEKARGVQWEVWGWPVLTGSKGVA